MSRTGCHDCGRKLRPDRYRNGHLVPAANGTFVPLSGTGSYDSATGTYAVSGDTIQVDHALRNLELFVNPSPTHSADFNNQIKIPIDRKGSTTFIAMITGAKLFRSARSCAAMGT
jgi:hypothetical protein